MQINRLEFEGVGVFRDKHIIDFDLLGSSGLYLIDGPTGAGKSTIIDCIVFALYGELASEDADMSRLRSRFAGPDQRTYIQIDFTTAKGKFRIERSPEYFRTSKRGGDDTRQASKASLFRMSTNGDLEPIENRINTLKTVIPNDYVGLTKAQFTQTVVLPQGEFAQFLRADTKERADLLKKLFGTELYTKIAELLKKDAASSEEQLSKLLIEARNSVEQFSGAVELDADLKAQVNAFLGNAMFTEAIAQFEPGSVSVQQSMAAIDPERQLAIAREAEALKTRDQRIKERDAGIKLSEAQTSLQAAEVEKSACFAELTQVADQLMKFAVDSTSIKSSTDLLAAREGLLAIQQRIELRLGDEQTVLEWPTIKLSYENAIKKLTAEIHESEERSASLPGLIVDLEKSVAQLPDIKVEIQRIEQDLVALALAEQSLLDFEGATNKISQLTIVKETSTALSQTASAAHAAAVESRIQNMAGEIASALIDGKPCVVCGSFEHPNPAKLSADPVTAEEIERLQNVLNQQLAALQKVSNELAAAESEVASLVAAGVKDATELAEAKSKLSLGQSKSKADLVRVLKAVDDLAKLRDEAQSLGSKISTARTQIAAKEAELETKSQQIDGLKISVIAESGDFDSLTNKLNALSGLLDLVTQASTQTQKFERASEIFNEAKAIIDLMDKDELFGEVTAADGNLSSARDARAQIENEFNSLRNAENAYVSVIAKLESVTAQYREQNAQNTDLIELSAMFNRDRENGQNLNIYVLAAIFKNVLAAANRHFEGLLGGQFRLELDSEANSDGRALRGLGVRVFDSHTGSYAPAKTLSGGETFCASLSLALGLADFVRQGAGGIEIGTLFIDEGFGSLSDGPLTDVMNMLTSLQRGGRTVGLISHVDEMKSQITEKIEVTKASKDSPATLTVSWLQPS